MKVTLIAFTSFMGDLAEEESGGKWINDEGPSASELTEFSGRQCYESWSRPNPATATVEGYIGNIIQQNHFSVLEHGSATFRVSGVSRSLTHELVRHRHMSFSQQSQRYVQVRADEFVVPPLFRGDDTSQTFLRHQWESAIEAYDALTARWLPILIQRGIEPHMARKMAREAARCVLPNMTPTAIVVTANHRTWREFLEKRGSIFADQEIRELAVLIYKRLAARDPALYQDFHLIGQAEPIGGFSLEKRHG
jgi:thymidylate synthase (FAD)